MKAPGRWRTWLGALLLVAVVSCSPSAERRLKWNLQTTVKDYEKIGRHDAKWDVPAKEALTLYAQWRSDVDKQTDAVAEQIARDCESAVAAGCRDSLVSYVHARFVANRRSHTDAEIAATHQQIAAALKASQYSSLRKFYGFLRAGEHLYQLKPVPKLEVTEMMNDAAAQLALALKANDAPYGEQVQASRAFMESFQKMEVPRNWGWGTLAPLLKKKWGANFVAELSRGETKVD